VKQPYEHAKNTITLVIQVRIVSLIAEGTLAVDVYTSAFLLLTTERSPFIEEDQFIFVCSWNQIVK